MEYTGNPKHHQNSKGEIGKPPYDGQDLLNQSRIAPGEKYRVAIQDNKYVIFREHSPGKWHGYVIDNYDKLQPGERNAFYKAGLIHSVKSGKIIK